MKNRIIKNNELLSANYKLTINRIYNAINRRDKNTNIFYISCPLKDSWFCFNKLEPDKRESILSCVREIENKENIRCVPMGEYVSDFMGYMTFRYIESTQ